MRVNPILARLGKYPLAEVQLRARRRREEGLPLIDFSIGDPREPTPEFIPTAMIEAIPKVSQYPTTRGTSELRTALAAYLRRRFGVEVDPASQVIPTTGAKEGIFHAPFAFIDPGADDLVVFGTPGYPVYERGALLAGASIHPIVLKGDFVLRAEDVRPGVWERATMLWICSPHNPTGAVTSRDELAELVEMARRHKTLLLSDECYSDIYEDQPPASVLEVAGPGYEGVLAFFSCSKRSGMTGYRAGAIVGDPGAIETLIDLRASAGVAPAEFVQAAAAAAWSDDAHAGARRAIFSEKRRILSDAFSGLGYDVVASRAALYLWVRVGDDLEVTEALLEHGVVVAPGRFFGPGGEGYVRLSLVPTVDECRTAVPVLKECLAR